MLVAASWVGTAPNWILVAMGLFVAWRVSRGGGGAALAEMERANGILAKSLTARDATIAALTAENTALRASRDYSAALAGSLAPLLEWTAGHEQRAAERHDVMMDAQKRATDALVNAIEQVVPVVARELANGREDAKAAAS